MINHNCAVALATSKGEIIDANHVTSVIYARRHCAEMPKDRVTADGDTKFGAEPLARFAATFQTYIHKSVVEPRCSPAPRSSQSWQLLGKDRLPTGGVVAEKPARQITQNHWQAGPGQICNRAWIATMHPLRISFAAGTGHGDIRAAHDQFDHRRRDPQITHGYLPTGGNKRVEVQLLGLRSR
jgi:hypothetical protein